MSTALVTGASSGLGLELARKLDERGHDLVLVARSAAALEELAGSLKRAQVVVADLATEAGREAVSAAADSVDILINNAGFGDCGPFVEMPEARSISMLETNCAAVVSLSRRFLPGMVERGSGKLLNVASTAAFQPGPSMAMYYASKAFVLSFTEAIAEELRGSGVSVTAFCPGAFESGFQAEARVGETRLVKGRKLPSSAALADAALKAMDSGRVVSVPGLMNKVGAASVRLTPRPAMRRIVSYIQGEA